jgi:hypothetical protein
VTTRAVVLALLVAAAAGCAGRTGGAYVWTCTPVRYVSGSPTPATVYVFNRSSTAANVAVNVLNKDGRNLAGVPVPGSAPGIVYSGHSGTGTVAVPPDETLLVVWQNAQGQPDQGDVAVSARIVSDQPIVVGSNVELGDSHPVACTHVPR